MEFNRQNVKSKIGAKETHIIDEGLRSYMLKVYNYMSSGILLTGLISLFLFKLSVVTNDEGAIIGLTSIGNALYNSALMWIMALKFLFQVQTVKIQNKSAVKEGVILTRHGLLSETWLLSRKLRVVSLMLASCQ